jgi:hypothetical protein
LTASIELTGDGNMMKNLSFSAEIKDPGGGGAYIEVPFDVEKIFGSKRPKVKASIEGEIYRGTLVRMGLDCHVLIIRKEIREKTGRSFGDIIQVTIELDTEARIVEIPGDLLKIFKGNQELQVRFEALSFTRKKEVVNSINQAKKAETRKKRIDKIILELSDLKH